MENKQDFVWSKEEAHLALKALSYLWREKRGRSSMKAESELISIDELQAKLKTYIGTLE